MATSKKAILAKLMKKRYPMLIQFDVTAGSWAAAYPDLPGCHTDGNSPTLAVTSAERARRVWTEVALDLGQAIPEPSDMVELMHVLKQQLKDSS